MSAYHISEPEYLDLLAKLVDGKCPICLVKKANVIDHCHKSGKVRGILCYHCNTALHLVEDKKSLQRAIDYLK